MLFGGSFCGFFYFQRKHLPVIISVCVVLVSGYEYIFRQLAIIRTPLFDVITAGNNSGLGVLLHCRLSPLRH